MVLANEELDDARGDETRPVDHQVGGLAVERITQMVQFFKSGKRILHAQQGTVAVMTCAFVQKRGGHIQIDHPTGIPQALAIFRAEDDPAPRAEDDGPLFGQFGQSLGFTTAKPLFAFDFEYGRDAYPSSSNDLVIGIEKATAQPTGQLTAYGGLSRAHEAY